MSHSSSSFRPALQEAVQSALEYLDSLETAPVAATATVSHLRGRMAGELNELSMPAEEVIHDLVRNTQGGIVGSAGGRFFAWGVGGCVPAALAADWLTSAWDQNAAIYASGPAAAVVEEVAGEWLKDLLGIPASASFGFVSGCQMAHVTCLAAARHALLQDRGWDVERQGLQGAPRIRVVTSNRHGSVERAVRLLGIGGDNIVDLELDENARVSPQTLDAALENACGAATIVVLQAGDLNSGSFDDYRAVIPVARRHGAWVHIDGAFGLWVCVSPRYRHFREGVEAADSWASDGHKWLNIPYDSGYAFVARPEAHRAAMSHRAPYLVQNPEARDQMDWNPEWSRRARGFATYAAIRQLGRAGIAEMIDRCCGHATSLVERIARLEGTEVVWQPRINQGLVRFLDPRPGATDEDHDRFTESMIQRILESGEAFFMATTWRGRRAMRVSVLNWQTSQADVERAVAAIAECLALSTPCQR